MNLYSRAELLVNFGEHLRQLRTSKKITFGLFEERSQIDPANLTKYENGFREPGLITLVLMSKGLDLSGYRELLDFPISKDLTNIEQLRVGGVDPICVLRSLMNEHGLRQKDIAKILNVSKGFVSNILSYKKRLSKNNTRLLADHFKVNEATFSRHYKLFKNTHMQNHGGELKKSRGISINSGTKIESRRNEPSKEFPA